MCAFLRSFRDPGRHDAPGNVVSFPGKSAVNSAKNSLFESFDNSMPSTIDSLIKSHIVMNLAYMARGVDL